MKYIRIPLLIAFLFCSCSLLVGQKLIQGIVIDSESHQSLIGALITIDENRGVSTDKNGYFEMSLDHSTTTIVVSYLGYKNLQIEVTEDQTDLGKIFLERSQISLDEITISAAGTNYNSKFNGSNFKISHIELKKINPISTEEVLKSVPGINIVGDMGISNRPNISIRGSWGRRSKKVLLLEDGTPAAPAPYIAPGAYYNPVSDRIRSIEVYKGADLLRFGPNNMYGAVNYITALPPQKPELRVKLLGGERDYLTGLLSYGGTWKNLGALVEGVYKSFGGFTDNSSVSILNLNAKIFAKLTENQSLYFKLSGQAEDNQASLSSITPFTYSQDAYQNPFDADQFTMRRYGVDLIHKWALSDNLSLKTKLYATDFERDWWRQVTTKVRASELRSYLGDKVFNERYSYVDGQEFNEDDYVIAGRIKNGRESTTDSRWTYTVAGVSETLNLGWEGFDNKHSFEASINLHRETFKDRFLESDSSRWARYGKTTKDLWYRLWSANGYIRNEFNIAQWSITPIARFEYVDMYRQDLVATSLDPDISNPSDGREPNSYTQILPGLSISYRFDHSELYSSLYKGMIAPSKVFGFLVERDGVITNPLAGQSINIKPEISRNFEFGWRGSILKNWVSGQLCYFNNTSWNFYAGGRNEVFEELGSIRNQGLEGAIDTKSVNVGGVKIGLTANLTLIKSKVLNGTLKDNDLFSQVIHSHLSRNEFITKVNSHRDAYIIHLTNEQNEEYLFAGELDEDTFSKISSCLLKFGDGYIEEAVSPYTPKLRYLVGINMEVKNISAGLSANVVSSQYTEFHNFKNESADGSIGQLPSYHTIDAYINYEFKFGDNYTGSLFLNGKNINNSIYKASRLNRATSGIFPGGFRQIIFGLSLNI